MSSTVPFRLFPLSLGALMRRSGQRALRLMMGPAVALTAARGWLFPFAPVAMGIGVGAYFAIPVQPHPAQLVMVWGLAVLCAGLAVWGPHLLRPMVVALSLAAIGFGVAAYRTDLVAAPVLQWRRYGPVEGRIVMVDRSVSDAVRLTLDAVVLNGLSPGQTPLRVRVSVHGDGLEFDPVAGMHVMMTAHLGPPSGPTEPGGFDFRRLAWFDRLGAVGYTRSPVMALAPPEAGLGLALTRLRQRISAGIRARLTGETGGFVAAILTGDRSGVGQDTTENLRRSNLAHLLAISGLHMGLLTGVVFGAFRAGLALFPWVALRLPIRKIAAIGALFAAAAYLALSGGNVATQRAFIMAATMLIAVVAERRAISLRSVGLAALIVLLWRPEALPTAGFQMSFAATVALVAVFAALRDRQKNRPKSRQGHMRRVMQPIVGAVLCSLVAGIATAPIAAVHFHRFTDYGLLANVVSVPLMGVLVMPAAVLAALLWPFGGEGLGLWLMELGTRWILGVAQVFGGMEDAIRLVAVPPVWALPALGLGGLWLALWRGRARLAGVIVIASALIGWGLAERPALLIDRDGGLVGLLTEEGRALSRARGAGYVARKWLESDGDAAEQSEAATRAGFEAIEGGVRFTHAGQTWFHLHGRRGEAILSELCAEGVTIVINARIDGPNGACRLMDARALSRSGSIAVHADGQEITARMVSGRRPWSGF